MLKKILLAVVFSTATVCNAYEFRRAKTFEDAYLASCRVDVSNARGTGTFIGVDKEKQKGVILTNYHVVTSNSVATLNFWKNGEQKKIQGRVFARYYDASMPADFALIHVELADLATINPPYVALGGEDAAPDVNSYILSSGAPKGRFVQAWRGRVLGYYRGATLLFQPGPVPGQSGSGVISEINGELWLTAILTWLIGTEGADDSKGGAIPIANLYKSLSGKRTGVATPVLSPIPPDAVECAASNVRVVEVTRNNCEACRLAVKDVDALKTKGVDVEVVDASNNQSSVVSKYAIKAFPTFLLYQNDKEVARWIGAGKAAEIESKINELDDSGTEAPPEPTPADNIDYSDELTNGYQSSAPVSADDFRNRESVYELADAGFFEDSDSCWRSRRCDPHETEPQTPETPPSEPKLDESKLGDRIGTRLSDSLSQKIGGEFGKAAGALGEELEKKFDSKIQAFKSEALAEAQKHASKACFLALTLVFLGCSLAFLAILAFIWLSVRVYKSFSDAQIEPSKDENQKASETKAKPVSRSKSKK